MADMLVKLYELPPLQPALDAITGGNIEIRPARIWEAHAIIPWIAQNFSAGWSHGIEYALHRSPCSLFIAIEKQLPDPNRTNPYDLPAQQLVGFAGYDISHRGVFGPIGVQASHEKRGIGTALLLTALHAMYNENSAYAIIGWAGPVDWYAKTVNATIIPDSAPGPFHGQLRGIGE